MFFIIADHAGFELKEYIKTYLDFNKINYLDLTPDYDESDDYPDYIKNLAEKLRDNKNMGIAVCGTGIGMNIGLNRFPWVRASLVTSIKEAELFKQHNDGNCLCFGGRIIKPEICYQIIQTFLKSDFSLESKHLRRIKKLTKVYNEV